MADLTNTEVAKIKIFVTTSFAAFHCWPDAPEPVAFLRNLHRHKFGVRVELGVTHADRDLEFFMVQANLNQVISIRVLPALQASSSLACENLATIIFNRMKDKYPTTTAVTVDEDGENGATVYEE